MNHKTSFVQRIKNLWAWSESTPVEKEKVTKKDIENLWDSVTRDIKPQCLAKIVKEPLPDNFEEDDTTN